MEKIDLLHPQIAYIFVGGFYGAMSVLHFILYMYNRHRKANLMYSLGLAAAFINFAFVPISTNPHHTADSDKINILISTLSNGALLYFISYYVIAYLLPAYRKSVKIFGWLYALGFLGLIGCYFNDSFFNAINLLLRASLYLVVGISCMVGLVKKVPNFILIVAATVLLVATDILSGDIFEIWGKGNYPLERLLVVLIGFTAPFIAYSVYLSKDLALTSKKLVKEHIMNERLSREKYMQELVTRKILEAQNVELERSVFERTREISMQKEELELQAEKIQELDKIKSRFFANISHEFRTPLTLIQGPIKKKLKETQDPKEARELNIVYQNSTRLLQLVNQLLDLSKLESGSFTLRPSKVDVVSRIRVVADGFQSLAEVKLINYKYYLPDHEVVVHLDIEKFDKIIINLLSNAFKFTPSGGEVSISLQSFAPNETYQSGYIQIEVTDTGIGIDPAHHSQVFNRFFQVDNSQTRKYDGTGIGLSITKEFIDLHQGDIKLKSNLGEGSTFVVTLPRLISGTTHLDNTLVDTSTTNEIHISTPSTNELPTRAEGEKILVIEDNADLRLYVKDSLSNHYQVMEAADGEEGINLAIAEVPDLIITDLMMPKTDGLQVCLTVKEDIRTSHIPVVLLTAKADIESKLEGLDTGADDYISKPFDMDELKLRIRNLIENRKKLREKYSRNFINLKPKEIDVQSTEEKFLLKITQVIEDHMSDSSFGVETFAREVAMSTAQLYRKINALTGKTPNDLIRDMRLKRASYLLNKKSGNIADVAFQVGFNNLSYFAKCFKEKYGETPSEYLKKTALL